MEFVVDERQPLLRLLLLLWLLTALFDWLCGC